MIKMKNLMEGKFSYNRKFGEKLPTIEDFTEKHRESKEGVNEGQKRQAADLEMKFDKAFLNFSKEIRDVIKMMERISSGQKDGQIINKAYKQYLIPFDKVFKSWAKGQQKNPYLDEDLK